MTDEFDRDEEHALTAEYVLGLLTEDETAAYEDVLSVDPDLRTEYAFWADRIVALTDDIAPVAPPPHVLTRIRETIFHEAAGDASRGAGGSWLRRLGLLPAMAGGLVAALLVLWVFTTMMPPTDGGDAALTYVAQIAADDDSLVVQASFDAAAGSLSVDRQVGAAPAGRALELWLIAGDNPPVSLGVMPEDRTATMPVSADLASQLSGGTLAISDEPAGGSTTGAPTGAVLATGQVTDA
ncbi:Anti-sigma-K factor RskA [Loktanella atrilutea]|uniref:Anti-sigma-K factor RskA n=1 Tax=Loktanella atrilutea TaxID=366533 RepID=A0A1M5B612_LOKAT|nr:anti-sigma factor [Loktanella atrilutea]SHF37943.1 Anti-sigma-K factor RskA [Loktanella atrilutea]